jgi:hypothetical protein
MKYIAVLLVAGAAYLLLARPMTPAGGRASSGSTPGSDFLKAPLDRTHEVLDQARTRASDPSLQ